MTKLKKSLLLLPLLMALNAFCAMAQAPRLFFTDLDSGPNAGGENVNGFAGAYVTLYGNFFGSSQGSSTVTWNGLNCLRVLPATGSYTGWGMAHFWYQKIIVQLGSGCTPGTGNFVVTVNGQASNGIPFTVRSGHIYFVSTTGSDSNAGTALSPWRTITHCRDSISAGDTCYIENGVSQTATDNYDAALDIYNGGTAGSPMAMVAYPGASVSIGNSTNSYGLRVPEIGISPAYWTFAEINFGPNGEAMNPFQANNWRIVGNKFQCPNANGQSGCYETNESSYNKFFGNEVTNVSTSLGFVANKQQHGVYWSSDSNHIEAGWNYIHDNMDCRAIQVHSSPLGGGGSSDPTGYNQYDISIHDNFIYGDPCDGINLATVDPSQGKVELYNNVIAHTGMGPSPQGGDSGDYSGIYFAYITNNGPVGGGTIEVYNNTLYDTGSYVGFGGENGAFMINGGETSLLIKLRNNLVLQLSNEPYVNGQGANSTYVSGSNNIWFGGSGSAPTFTSGNITSNPLLVNPSLHNFQSFELQSGSPAIDAGVAISSSNTYKNYPPWQGGTPLDQNGITRPQGSAFDIGAYEYYTGGSTAQKPNPPTSLSAVAH
jgi:hypothetical protein